MPSRVVITGIGMVTPLGLCPGEVLRLVETGESAAGPMTFDTSPFACRVGGQVREFRAQDYVAETKMIRLMNRDSQLAVAAAHLALQDSRLRVGVDYQPDEIALYGATGMAGLPLNEVAPMIERSVDRDGQFDLGRFGQEGLRSISPLLSFKVLGNMPVCFVSICENIQGPNGIYTPWEGQGAQAIAAGIWVLQRDEARCALVGGCDVKTHELAFIALEQLGLFQSWKDTGAGLVPGEGAVFLVLEQEENARRRGAPIYARMAGLAETTARLGAGRQETYTAVLRELTSQSGLASDAALSLDTVVSGADEDGALRQAEIQALTALAVTTEKVIRPKPYIGNLFAAAAALQVGLGALLTRRSERMVLANCFGHGSEQAAFLLKKP